MLERAISFKRTIVQFMSSPSSECLVNIRWAIGGVEYIIAPRLTSVSSTQSCVLSSPKRANNRQMPFQNGHVFGVRSGESKKHRQEN